MNHDTEPDTSVQDAFDLCFYLIFGCVIGVLVIAFIEHF